MENTPDNSSEYHPNDEIDLTELFSKVWKRKGIIFLFVIIFLLTGFSWILLNKSFNQNHIGFYISLSEIKNGKYPNGTKFSPQDLLSPDAAERVKETFHIPEHIYLSDHIDISYGSPLMASLEIQYKNDLLQASKNKATTAEISRINEAYTELFKQTIQQGLYISINTAGLQIDSSTGFELARTLPSIWEDIFIKKYRIFDDPGVARHKTIFNQANLSTYEGVIASTQIIHEINDGLKAILEDNRYKWITTNKGLSAPDIRSKLDRFSTLYFEPIFRSAFTNETPQSSVYRMDLQYQIVELATEKEQMDKTIDLILGNNHSRSTEIPSLSNIVPNQGLSQLQLESSALDTVINIARQSSQSEYLQKLFDQRQNLVGKIAKLTTQISKTSPNSDQTENEMKFEETYISNAENYFNGIVGDYMELMEKTQNHSSTESKLYTVLTEPRLSFQLVERKDLMILLASITLGSLFGLFFVLVFPEKKQTPQRP